MRALRLRVLGRIGVALILAGIALGPLTAPVGAAGECYWSSLQDHSATKLDGSATWVMRVKYQYGYNCTGAIITMKVTYASVWISFYNGGDYDPDIVHKIYVSQLWPWPNPAGSPAWENLVRYSCTGGCTLFHAYTFGSPITWRSSAYSGSGGKGFSDSMFYVTCFDCGVAGGNLRSDGNFRFTTSTLAFSGGYGGSPEPEGFH